MLVLVRIYGEQILHPGHDQGWIWSGHYIYAILFTMSYFYHFYLLCLYSFFLFFFFFLFSLSF